MAEQRKYPQLVWRDGLRGPIPEIWHNESCEKQEGRQMPVLQRNELAPTEADLGLSELRGRYPLKIAGVS